MGSSQGESDEWPTIFYFYFVFVVVGSGGFFVVCFLVLIQCLLSGWQALNLHNF